MLPLVTTVEEVLESRAIMEEEAAALKRDNIPAAASVPIGVMIETPAAVMIADHLARVSAFFSVGTNDLTQYTWRWTGATARLANRFSPHHPAVIRQLARVAEGGHRCRHFRQRLWRDGVGPAVRGAADGPGL
jgi:phosphoenolpyruvate-protein kinase (PTS system EI component)